MARYDGGVARGRPGFTIAELVVALTIGGLLCTAIATAFTGTQRFARLHGERAAIAEARRVTSMILSAELRYLEPDLDLDYVGEDSLVLRNYRGTAIVCESVGEVVTVRYRGMRAPDPEKDSVAIVGTPGPSRLLESAPASTGCAAHAGESLYRWRLERSPATGELLLLYEHGSYHLVGGALRYRRGLSGRQPLTAELFDDDLVGLNPTSARGIELVLGTGTMRPVPLPVHRADPRVARYLLTLVNGWRQ